MIKLILLFILVIFSLNALYAQKPAVNGVETDIPVIIDGDLSELCWQKPCDINNFYYRTDSTKAIEDTNVWITYDKEYIYVAFYCRDRDPQSIKAEQTKRGGGFGSDDWVGIYFDCCNKEDNIVWFQVSAGGVQQEDLQSGGVSNITWRGDWHAASKRQSDGYTVEMKIPFSILPYDPNLTEMSIAFARQSSRLDQRWYSPDLGPNGDVKKYYIWHNLHLPKKTNKPLMLTYGLIGYDEGKAIKRMGVDMKGYITPNISSVFTINPDFKSVEQQVDSVDFSYNEQWRPDGRPFFQQSERYFPGDDIFYTIRIPDIDFGTKLYGTMKNVDTGFIYAGEFDGDGYTALKMSKSWPGKAYLGASGAWSSIDGNIKDAGTIYGNYKLHEKNDQSYSAFMLYSSADNADVQKYGERLEFGIDADARPKSLGVSVTRRITDIDYLPKLGYTPENNLSAWHLNASIYDRPAMGSISNWRGNIYTDFVEHQDGSPYYKNIGINSRIVWRSGRGISLHAGLSNRPPYNDKQIRLGYWWGNKTLYRRGSINFAKGRLAGGDYLNYSIGQGWDLNNKLSLYLSYEMSEISPPSPDAYSVNQIILTVNYDINSEKSLSGRMISTDGKQNIYIAYRQRVRDGLDIYMILGDPNSEETKEVFLLKTMVPIKL